MKIPGFKCRCAPRLNMFHRCRDLAPKIQAPSPLPANSVCTAFLRTPGFNQLCLSRATSISTSLVEAGLKGPSRPRCAWTHKPRPAGPRRGNACRGCQVDPPRVATLSTRQAGCACPGQSGSSPRTTPSAWRGTFQLFGNNRGGADHDRSPRAQRRCGMVDGR
jgi:hypothetical protein